MHFTYSPHLVLTEQIPFGVRFVGPFLPCNSEPYKQTVSCHAILAVVSHFNRKEVGLIYAVKNSPKLFRHSFLMFGTYTSIYLVLTL